ncbi:hypothetical protein [Mycobacterium canetti]|uniref:hypothetical protein n=1 Tax=Mycobacterium canetti TaxID=78331 RepID=UPI002AAB520C|nr:hypothetical protein [Mycobacterium canetti]
MIPTQSTLRAYTVSHLTENAAHWRELAARRRSVVGTIKSQADSLDWQGHGDEAMKAAMARHAVTAEQEAELLDTAAATAEDGAAMLHQQKHSIFATVEQANQSGFAVAEGWTATDAMYAPGSMGWYARQPNAQAISADLRVQLTRFTGQEVQTATDVARSAGELGGEGAVRGHIQAVAAITTTHAPNPTVPPSPLAPSASQLDVLTGASPLIQHISPQAAASAAAPTWQAPPAAGELAGIAPPVPLPPGAGPLPAFGGSVGGGAGAGTGGSWLSSLAARLSSGIAATAPVSKGAVSTAATVTSAPAAAAATAAATPLAHGQPHPSPPTAEPPATQFADPGKVRHEHAPQHLPSTDPPQAESPHARQSPAAQSSPPTPAPVTLEPDPAGTAPSDTTPGTGNNGVQMLGFGPPGLVPAPTAPSFPLPRDPALSPMPVDPKDMSAEQAIAEWANVNAEIRAWNARCGVENVGPLPPAQYNACIASRGPLLERLAAIRARLNDLGIPIGGEHAPATTRPGTAGSEPPPNQPGTPSSQEPVPPAQETPPFPPPNRINGITDHGAGRIAGRDGGHGVSDKAMQDAVANPVGPPQFKVDELGRGAYVYVGKDATVVLNKDGQVVTAWANSRAGWRNP